MKKGIFLIIGSFLCINTLLAQPKGIDTLQLYSVLGKSLKIIDIRHPREWKKIGLIPNAYKITLYAKSGQKKEFSQWLSVFGKVVRSPQQPFVLVSIATKEAKVMASKLDSMGYRNVHFLKGGMHAWISNNKPVVTIKGKLKR